MTYKEHLEKDPHFWPKCIYCNNELDPDTEVILLAENDPMGFCSEKCNQNDLEEEKAFLDSWADEEDDFLDDEDSDWIEDDFS